MVEYGAFDATIFAPELWAMAAHWQGLEEAAGRLPQASALTAYVRRAALAPDAALIARMDEEFVVIGCGFGLIRRFGRFAQGARLGELASDIAENLRAVCALAFEHVDVVATQPRIAYGSRSVAFDEIVLPLASGEACVLLLAACERQRGVAPAGASNAVAASIAFAAL